MASALFHITHSKAESFRRCRKQYWFRYVSGEEWPEPEPNVAGVIGTGIHRAMKVLCETGEPELGAGELDAYLRMPAHECASPGTEGFTLANEFYARGCEAHASLDSAERWAELDTWVPDHRTGLNLRAKFDRVDRFEVSGWQVIDWKTGVRDADESTDAQLDLAHVALRTIKRLPRDEEVVAIGWNLRTGRQRVRALNRDHAAATVKRMYRMAEAMLAEKEFAATPGPQCGFCDFRARCPDADYVLSGRLDWLDDDELDFPPLALEAVENG